MQEIQLSINHLNLDHLSYLFE